ncbi:hypothetical protein [Desulfotruncus alcoholivorax]|uniref:hypothetical protein n=1 Tax=Desulfotruncus alcoholivorax TaxID=265477 RepID=UPI0003F57240|nr:hypothetical protein [Desulfotruncus alcoholivorax]
MNLSELIDLQIKKSIVEFGIEKYYREPLLGFASADDHLFTQIKQIVGPHHLHPREFLPGAKTVVAFFIPFSDVIISANRKTPGVAREWAEAYIETNRLITGICGQIINLLEREGYSALAEKPTHNFNEDDLTAGWSHKSVAFVAGLGTFGVNRMLITRAGCAGRLGSVVTSAVIPPSPKPQEEYCGYYSAGKCLYCVKHCPTGALKTGGIDKHTCYRRLLEVDREFADLELCDVCGKCAVGPCAAGPVK